MTTSIRRVNLGLLTPSRVGSRPFTVRIGAPMNFQVQAGISPALVDRIRRISAAQMFALDSTWAAKASKVDARLCIAGSVRPYDRTCGGNSICDWAYLRVEGPCDLASWANVMFQSARYTWCQEQLRHLLANRPSVQPAQSAESASAWADWCIAVMRLVSMANWSTNMHPRYLVPMHERPAARAAMEEIRSYLPATPSKDDPRDQIETRNAFTMVMATPRTFEVSPSGEFAVPTKASDFDPVWVARNLQLSLTERPWPYEHFGGRAPESSGAGSTGSSRVRDALVAWFTRTLDSTGGSNFWWSGRRVRAQVMGRVGCPPGPSAVCSRTIEGLPHWWGSGSAQVRMCEAWAQDIVETSFGKLCSDSMQRFVEAYAAVPEHMRGLTNTQLGEVRNATTERIFNEAAAAVGTAFATTAAIASAINPVAGAIIGLVGGLVAGLLQMLQALGLAGYGGGEMAAACIPAPVIRQIPAPSTNTCHFDPRNGEAERVASQVMGAAAAAARELPVDIWFEAAKEAAGEDSALPDAGGGAGADSTEGGVSPLLVVGGIGILGLVGYFALRGRG